MEKIPVSIVILTKNEEKNIEDCIKSVLWSDDIIIIDDFSRDRTVDIAKSYTASIYQKKMDVEGIHRNWGYGKAKNEWVLSLDADETATDGLRLEIKELIEKNTEFNGFSIPLRNYLGDYWIKYGGWYPAEKLRLFKRDKFKYEEVGVHPRAFLEGKCGHLKQDIIHKGYPDFAHFLESINRQTTLEARKWVADKRPMSLFLTFRKGADRFIKGFILKRGYKDGFIGFMVSFFASLYQLLSYAKYWEIKRNSGKKP